MSPTSSKQARITFASLTENNLGTVRKLNSVLFPIKYSEKFYRAILQPEVEEFCKLVYYNDIPVGTICCRFENKGDQNQLYLMTMGILAPYRSRGLGSKALELILAAASGHRHKIDKVYLHVQVSNEEAKKFYQNQGFVHVFTHEGYYNKIAPADAWVLEKTFS